jgi:endonuclease YncB( thermonuclease family)
MGCILGKSNSDDIQPFKEKNSVSLNSMEQKEIDWEMYDFNTTSKFSFEGCQYVCRVLDVYDGDTITCALPVCGNVYKFTIRLADIDTCEMRSKNEEVKEKAYEAKQFLLNLILTTNNVHINFDKHISRADTRDMLSNNICLVNIYCSTFDKYGRLLAWVFPKNNDYTLGDDIVNNKLSSFNNRLISNKLAYHYEGNTKIDESRQLEILNLGAINLDMV